MAEEGSFDSSYEGIPPWDIGRPQKEIIGLAEAGNISGEVLDVGCGTGENALYLAGLGHQVLGIDSASTAIDRARAKASQRGSVASFGEWDALDLHSLGRSFDTIIDVGLFHVFTDEERPRFAKSLAAVLRPTGMYYLLCFSEREPGSWGPRRVTQEELRSVFQGSWEVDNIQEARFETNLGPAGVLGWLAAVKRL